MKKLERFDNVKLSDQQMFCIGEIKNAAKELESEINTFVLDGREKSIALTKLEEVVMWANKGFSRNKENAGKGEINK